MNIFHRDIMNAFFLVEVIHLAYILMPDLPGKFKLIAEPFYCIFIRSNFWLKKFKGYFLF
ncbi:hypothetical protein ES703_37462 [subsurface metagenome]